MAESTDVVGAHVVPAELLAAFERYEAAIVANDLDVLDDAFATGPDTMRGASVRRIARPDEIAYGSSGDDAHSGTERERVE